MLTLKGYFGSAISCRVPRDFPGRETRGAVSPVPIFCAVWKLRGRGISPAFPVFSTRQNSTRPEARSAFPSQLPLEASTHDTTNISISTAVSFLTQCTGQRDGLAAVQLLLQLPDPADLRGRLRRPSRRRPRPRVCSLRLIDRAMPASTTLSISNGLQRCSPRPRPAWRRHPP